MGLFSNPPDCTDETLDDGEEESDDVTRKKYRRSMKGLRADPRLL